MEEEIFIYRPKLRSIGMICITLFVLLVGNIYLLSVFKTVWLYVPLLILFGTFVILIHPVLKNQRIMLSDKRMYLLTFGKHNEIDIEKDLDEVVVRGGEVVSYRFEKDGMHFQVSPDSYYEHRELKNNLERTIERYNLSVSEVSG